MVYRKGAKAERELAEILWKNGWAVVRSAGSGHNYAPDVIGVKQGMVIGFECKASEKEVLYLRREQLEKMRLWQERSGGIVVIAWRRNGKKWKVFDLKEKIVWGEGIPLDTFITLQ